MSARFRLDEQELAAFLAAEEPDGWEMPQDPDASCLDFLLGVGTDDAPAWIVKPVGLDVTLDVVAVADHEEGMVDGFMWRVTRFSDDASGVRRTSRLCSRWLGFSRLAGRSAVAVVTEAVEAANGLLDDHDAQLQVGVRSEIRRRMQVIEEFGNLLEQAQTGSDEKANHNEEEPAG